MVCAALEAVRALGPDLETRSNEIERNRALPVDLLDRLKPTGAFRMYVPLDLGGPGLTAWESLQVIEELAFHDGATGWCAMIGSTTSLLSSYLPAPHAEEVFGAPDSVSGGFAMPCGRAVPVEGGLRVTGRWAWGSGTRHCTWIGGGALVVGSDGKPQPRADGLAAPFVFFRPEEVEFIDNWDVSGLSGSGSGDYEVRDVFVPEGRWAQMDRAPVLENTFSRLSMWGLLACGVSACALGLGRRAVHELVELAGAKRPQGSKRILAERGPVQAEVASSEAQLASAWAFVRDAIGDAWATAEKGERPSLEQMRQLRLAATHATHSAAEVTEKMYKAGGGAAVYRTSPLQRVFRDAHVATQHVLVAPRTLEMIGRLRLGLETDTRAL